nr:uncharacterized protein LOC104108623 [Nicotiana tomentosiformis]
MVQYKAYLKGDVIPFKFEAQHMWNQKIIVEGETIETDRYHVGHMYYYLSWLEDDVAGHIKPGVYLKDRIIDEVAEVHVKYKRLRKRVFESEAKHLEQHKINMIEPEEENVFVDIDEYIEDINAIVPPRVDDATFQWNTWIQNLPPNSIHTGPELVRAFLAKWFPQSKKSELRDKAFFFKQLPGEHLLEACDIFKLYLVRSPNYGFPDNILLQKFYMSLDQMNQSISKNAEDGSFMDKTFARVTQILDKMAEHNQASHSEDTMSGIAYGTPSLTKMIKRNQEGDQVIARLATNVNVLTKMFTESQTKKVNVVEDLQPMSNEEYEEENYVNNPQGGYQRQPYQGSGQQHQWMSNPQAKGNQQWRNSQGSSNQEKWSNNNNSFSNRSSNPYVPPKGQYSNSPRWKETFSSESKLENMLERVLQNQERSDTSMRNMIKLVGSHTASIQKLEIQMRDLSKDQNLKQKGTLPSDTIANPKGSGSGENEQVVKVEDSEPEVEAQVEVPNIVEVERLPKKVRTQEVNHGEVKGKVIDTPKTLAPITRPHPPFPQILVRKLDDIKLKKIYDIIKKLSMNIPFVEAFQEMSGIAKYLKDLITMNKTTMNEVVNVTHRVSSIIATTAVQKKEDP